MYIINLTYKVSLNKIDEFLSDHVEFLREQYRLGNFHASGRKTPRTGGVILSKISDKELLMNILAEDPFKANDLADYEMIEFVPTMTCKELEFLKD